jgi:hypothetical protein
LTFLINFLIKKKGDAVMKRVLKNNLPIFFSFLAMPFYLMSLNPGVVFGANEEGKVTQVTTKIKHKPISYFVTEKRIRLDAEAKDKAGIELVRCYFKGKAEADYVFVTMNQGEIGEYSAILPAPDQKAEMIEYLFLVVNKSNQVVKTQTFNVKRNLQVSKIPSWQNLPLEGDIKVGIELGEAPERLEGFNDSISMDIVESGLRFGFVAGLYSSAQMAAAGGVGGGTAATATAGSGTVAAGGGTAAAATAGGTVAATSSLSTAAIAGMAIGGAAVVGGGAAAAGGGGGGGSGSGGGSSGGGGTSTDYSKYAGTWSDSWTLTSKSGISCGSIGATGVGNFTINVTSAGAVSVTPVDTTCSATCSASFNGNVLFFKCFRGVNCCAVDANTMTFSDQNHGTGYDSLNLSACPTNNNDSCLFNMVWTR